MIINQKNNLEADIREGELKKIKRDKLVVVSRHDTVPGIRVIQKGTSVSRRNFVFSDSMSRGVATSMRRA